MCLLKKIFKPQGHKRNSLGALILLRNIFFYKNFYALKRNLNKLNNILVKNNLKNYCLYEIGTGYTLSDSLLLNYHFKFNKIFLMDINDLIYPRLYCFFMLACPLNYFEKEFWFYFTFLLKTMFFGWKTLNNNNVSFSKEIKLNKNLNYLIYSNSVLEHLNIKSLKSLFQKISISEKYIFSGIIDTNDHLYSNEPTDKHFNDFINNDKYIQIRGNNINIRMWKNLLNEYFCDLQIHPLEKRGPLSRVLYFTSNND